MKDILISKLGKTKAGERSRIWLQGTRLIKAGFTAGHSFGATWSKGKLTLTRITKDADEKRTISGKPGSPIIDIVGKNVTLCFGAVGSHVEVEFQKGSIVIKPTKVTS